MRPIDKGENQKKYNHYNDARDDLFERLGSFCSYCEMKIINSAEIEHVIPRSNGGDELNWDNFLLSCKYCNTNKSNRNLGRENYLWPDIHNTFKAFKYDEINQVTVNENLSDEEKLHAKNTIDLLKLDRNPASIDWDNHKDTRYKSRYEAWSKAKDSLSDYKKHKLEIIAKSISKVASSTGHFSIWMEVFKDYNEVRKLIINEYIGTNTKYFRDIIGEENE